MGYEEAPPSSVGEPSRRSELRYGTAGGPGSGAAFKEGHRAPQAAHLRSESDSPIPCTLPRNHPDRWARIANPQLRRD